MINKHIKNLTFSAVSLALCILLPFLTGNNYQLGTALSLMHLPVMLCGFICGWHWGAAVGIIAPLLRFLLLGAPPFPTCVSMAFELCVYGLLCGFLYKIFPKKYWTYYAVLIIAMICGRIVNGAVQYILITAGINTNEFILSAIATSLFIKTLPAIIIQLILIPIILFALKKAKLIQND